MSTTVSRGSRTEPGVIDVSFRGGDGLSNLKRYPFWLDRVQCASMEGFLHSLLQPDEGAASRVRAMHGYAANAASRGGAAGDPPVGGPRDPSQL